MINYYDDLAKHLDFKPEHVEHKSEYYNKSKYKEKEKGYESMNVIYNIEDKEVYVMAAVGSSH